jgi:sigma-B regulation protein RsbU (phosphoserine phosphatase)
MARLVVLNGPDLPESFQMAREELVIGRQAGVDVKLSGTNVSRKHARIFTENSSTFLEDLGSSNGTFLNGNRVQGRMLLKPHDQLRVGPYSFRFELAQVVEPDVTIRAHTVAKTTNAELFRENPAQKLQLILQLAHHLSRSLDLDDLFSKLLENLFEMFPRAERGLVLMFVNDRPEIRASKNRAGVREAAATFSHGVLRRVVDEGVGIVAEDIASDSRFAEAQSLCGLGVRSFICVPLRAHGGKFFGVLQLERFGSGKGFTQEDLNLLTAVGLQASVVLENAQLHQELIIKQRLERDLALAREIQASFLPQGPPPVAGEFELHAQLDPAYEVSGDFYDYFKFGGSKLAFAVADVSGKGISAALFMTVVRFLLRHVAESGGSPGEILQKVNNTLAQDNPKCLFVTVVFGVFDPASGELQVASAGHPPGLLRLMEGTVSEIAGKNGPLLGFVPFEQPIETSSIQLPRDAALLFFTDGVTEAPGPAGLFGTERLLEAFARVPAELSVEATAQTLRHEVKKFSGEMQQEDDITMLVLRRL